MPIVTVQNRYNLADRESENMTAAESEAMVDIYAPVGRTLETDVTASSERERRPIRSIKGYQRPL